MNWVSAGTPGGIDDATGYPVEGTIGEAKFVPCRFHLGGVKVFKNQDNTEVSQVGTIRMDAGVELPEIGTIIEVDGQYKGTVKDIYRGQLSYRIDV